MTTDATFHYMKNGEFYSAGTLPTDHTDPQTFCDLLAGMAKDAQSGVDQVQVWFGPLDGRPADATAEVTR